eukprot:Nk52_evm40s1360 gene=Nk52_evmTU40s1360
MLKQDQEEDFLVDLHHTKGKGARAQARPKGKTIASGVSGTMKGVCEHCKTVHDAAKKEGHFNCLWWLISVYSHDINEQDGVGNTCVHYAARNANLESLRWLLINGGDVGMLNDDGRLPIHEAAAYGNVEGLEMMAVPAVLGFRDGNGNTPLHIAAGSGCKEAVHALVIRGAHLDVLNDDHLSPLHLAAKKGAVSVVEYLIKKGASTAKADGCQLTPLEVAKKYKQDEAVEFLESADSFQIGLYLASFANYLLPIWLITYVTFHYTVWVSSELSQDLFEHLYPQGALLPYNIHARIFIVTQSIVLSLVGTLFVFILSAKYMYYFYMIFSFATSMCMLLLNIANFVMMYGFEGEDFGMKSSLVDEMPVWEPTCSGLLTVPYFNSYVTGLLTAFWMYHTAEFYTENESDLVSASKRMPGKYSYNHSGEPAQGHSLYFKEGGSLDHKKLYSMK